MSCPSRVWSGGVGSVRKVSGFAIDIDGPVLVATMADGENRLGTPMLGAWNDLIDEAEGNPSVSSLVVTGNDRHWSTGLDLDEVLDLDDTARHTFMRKVDLLLGRLLTAPLVTVAALNGHTYAAGALLALAFDYRTMREDRGFFCLPSVDVGIPFSPGMSALIAAKLPQPIAHDLVVSCRRIGGHEAARSGVIHRAVDATNVLHVARELAHAYSGKDPETLTTVKRRMYPEAAGMLTPQP
jgi:enoyl-CoA hydratase/carnithine racemase